MEINTSNRKGKSEFDLARARLDTPGCEHVLHFNNAGAGLMPGPVLDAMLAHLRLEAEAGGYEAELRAEEVIEHAYDAAASLLGCDRDEIAILENATRAWDMAFLELETEANER